MEVNRDSKFLPNLMELEFERIIEKCILNSISVGAQLEKERRDKK